MFDKKYVKIKDEIITLCKIQQIDGEFICAVNNHPYIVAKCHFDIVKKFSRNLTTQELELTEKLKSYKLYRNNKFNLTITSKTLSIYKNNIHDNLLTLDNHTYILEDTFCRLDNIEICDDKYYKVGLGSAIIKHLSNYAKASGCKRIQGWYYPNGRFEEGAKDFYIRNGFEFVQDEYNNKTNVVKNLEVEN